jgi:hypothetical protein
MGFLSQLKPHLGGLPTNRRLVSLSSLHIKCQPREALNVFWVTVSHSNNEYKIPPIPLRMYFTVFRVHAKSVKVWGTIAGFERSGSRQTAGSSWA